MKYTFTTSTGEQLLFRSDYVWEGHHQMLRDFPRTRIVSVAREDVPRAWPIVFMDRVAPVSYWRQVEAYFDGQRVNQALTTGGDGI